MKTRCTVVPDSTELSRIAAEEFVRQIKGTVRAHDLCTVVLSGGSTPKGLYALLASDEAWQTRLPWDKIHFFWGDERHVPPDHPDSNYRVAHQALLSKVPVPLENVHRIAAENPNAHQAAEEYEQTLRTFFRLAAGQLPRFDLILLGMGPDGHTASLFPGTAALHESQRLVVANWVEKFHTYRITLTLPVFNNAARVLFLVSGEEKAEVLRAVLQGHDQPPRFPAQLICPTSGEILWLVDQDAARLLHRHQ